MLNQSTRFQRGELRGFQVSPRAAPPDDLVFVEPVDGFCEGIVVAVADAANGVLDTGLGEPLRVAIETYWADSRGRRNGSISRRLR